MTASVPHAIREVLSSNTLYLQALKSGIANYTALAQRIKSDVETIVGSQVNVGTIVVAIKRFADILEKEKQDEEKKPINTHPMNGARMSLTGSIIDIDFDRELDELSNILDEVFEKESGYNLFQTNKQ
jgi:ABC-type bacteriocin/lantibiotic exporter with double-glycine peptidase domain